MAPSEPATPASTADTIERAALEVFYSTGYHGASIRAIAGTAGIGIATLFHHYPTKAAILERILHRAVDAMQAVRALVVSHCERQSQSFVAQSELRSLGEQADEEIRAKRRRVQGVFDTAIADGLASGQFSCDHPREVSRAIVSMGTMVATWYRPGAGLTANEVADIHVGMALRLVGAAVPDPV